MALPGTPRSRAAASWSVTRSRWSSRFPRSRTLDRTPGHEPPRVLDHRVDDRLGLAAAPGPGDLVGALADQRGEDGGVHPVLRHVGQVQQRVVLADPFPASLAPQHLEPGRRVAGGEQKRQVATLPAALQEGTRPGLEQLPGIGHALLPDAGHRLARGLLVRELVLLPERDEQLALPAEVMVEAADAGPGPLHDVGDARLGEASLGEYLPGRVQQRALRLRGAAPLPGAAGGAVLLQPWHEP